MPISTPFSKTRTRRWERRGKQVALPLAIFAVAAGAAVWWWLPTPPPSSAPTAAIPAVESSGESPETEIPSSDAAAPAVTEPELESQLIGEWSDEFFGQRVVSIRDDGTAQMSIDLEGFWAAVHGPRLEFDANWSLEGDILRLHTVGGRPKRAAEMLLKLWGRTFEERVVSVDDETLKLAEDDGEPRVLTRCRSDEDEPATGDRG